MFSFDHTSIPFVLHVQIKTFLSMKNLTFSVDIHKIVFIFSVFSDMSFLSDSMLKKFSLIRIKGDRFVQTL